jgi:hypothetical protein
MDVAQCAHLRHGRRASRERALNHQTRSTRSEKANQLSARKKRTSSNVHYWRNTKPKAVPITPPQDLWDDGVGVIAPDETRQVLGVGIMSIVLNSPKEEGGFGVFRMYKAKTVLVFSNITWFCKRSRDGISNHVILCALKSKDYQIIELEC